VEAWRLGCGLLQQERLERFLYGLLEVKERAWVQTEAMEPLGSSQIGFGIPQP